MGSRGMLCYGVTMAERDREHRDGRRGQTAAERGGAPPIAHSLLEERLYLLMARCDVCGGGPLVHVSQTIERGPERTFDHVTVRCPRCERTREFRFDITGFFGRYYPRREISDRPEPSHLLDRVAWVRWARLYLRAFAEGFKKRGEGPAAVRPAGAAERLDCGVLALRCLDEALKFHDAPDFDPTEAALHSPGSFAAFREAPDRYSRIEVLGLKLQVAMMLAAAGVDPDAPDARSGALEPAPPRVPIRLDGGGLAPGPAGGPGKALLKVALAAPALGPAPEFAAIAGPPAVKLLRPPPGAPPAGLAAGASPAALAALEVARRASRLGRLLAAIAVAGISLGLAALALAIARAL